MCCCPQCRGLKSAASPGQQHRERKRILRVNLEASFRLSNSVSQFTARLFSKSLAFRKPEEAKLLRSHKRNRGFRCAAGVKNSRLHARFSFECLDAAKYSGNHYLVKAFAGMRLNKLRLFGVSKSFALRRLCFRTAQTFLVCDDARSKS